MAIRRMSARGNQGVAPGMLALSGSARERIEQVGAAGIRFVGTRRLGDDSVDGAFVLHLGPVGADGSLVAELAPTDGGAPMRTTGRLVSIGSRTSLLLSLAAGEQEHGTLRLDVVPLGPCVALHGEWHIGRSRFAFLSELLPEKPDRSVEGTSSPIEGLPELPIGTAFSAVSGRKAWLEEEPVRRLKSDHRRFVADDVLRLLGNEFPIVLAADLFAERVVATDLIFSIDNPKLSLAQSLMGQLYYEVMYAHLSTRYGPNWIPAPLVYEAFEVGQLWTDRASGRAVSLRAWSEGAARGNFNVELRYMTAEWLEADNPPPDRTDLSQS